MSEPATEKAAPAPPGKVRLAKADGTHVILPAEAAARVLRLDPDGYHIATEAEIRRREAEIEYGDQNIRSFAEGAAAGLTFGGSDYLQDQLGLATKEELLGRREANPIAHGVGEAVGMLGGAVATAGVGAGAEGAGLAARMLAASPAGLAARAGVAATEGVEAIQAARALSGAAQATGAIGRAAAAAVPVAAGAALEGSLYGAAKQVNDDWLRDHEITTERIAIGAGLGALTSGAFGAGAGVIGSLAKEAAPLVRDALGHAGSARQFANERAVKAMVGQTSKKQVTLAGRFGEDMEAGLDKVGHTILDDAAEAGLNFATASKDDLAKFAQERRAHWGQRLDQIQAEADGILGERGLVAVSGPELKARIEQEVLAPLLSSGASRQTGKQLRARVKDVLEQLEQNPDMTVTSSRELRIGFDKHKINHDKLTRTAVDDAALDVRRILEEANADAVQRAGLGDEYAKAKLRYGVSAWAEKATQQVAAGDVARRYVSPSDYGIGAAVGVLSGIATGGVSAGALAAGFLASQGNKVLRDRGSQFLAGILDAVSGKSAAHVAVRGEQAIADAADGFVANIARNAHRSAVIATDAASVLGAALVTRDAASYERALDRVERLRDPQSDERQALRRNYAPVTEAAPQMAQAIEAHVQKTADFLAKKAGPRSARPDAPGAFSHLAPPKHSQAKAAKLARYADAAENPQRALERIKKGQVVREDVETLRELYPRTFRRLQARVAAQAADVTERPTRGAQDAFVMLTGMGSAPRKVSALQALARKGIASGALAADRGQAVAPSRAKAPDVADAYATRFDRLVE